MAFKDIENGNPVFASGFHANLRAVMLKKPVAAGFEVRVEGSEPLFLIRGNAFEISSGDAGSDKVFVGDSTLSPVLCSVPADIIIKERKPKARQCSRFIRICVAA